MNEDKLLEFKPLKKMQGNREICEFDDFLDSLPQKDKEKMLLLIKNVEEKGLEVARRMEWVKKFDDGIFELRSKVSSNIQRAMYFQRVGNEYIITHGFTKKSQKTPQKEIDKAKRLRKLYEKGECIL